MKFDKKYARNFFKSKKRVIILVIILALVIFRLFLPLIVKNYVNKALNNIPGYHGSVDDIDISLYRGAYVINGLHLFKNGDKVAMLDLPQTDISIDWGSLFHGRVVSKIKMFSPKYNYLVSTNKLSANQTPGKADWTVALKKLVPIEINRLTIEDGQFLYSDIIESPDINLKVEKIDLVATNLGNVVDKSKILPSDVTIHAISFGGGNLDVTAQMNMLKEIPDMDVNLALTKSKATALNSLTLSTAGFDFEKGTFELFSEFAINNGYLKGYVKPMFRDIRIPDTIGQPNSSFIKRIWEGVITFFGFILTNHKMDTFATKVPIEGDLNDPKTKIWPLITNIFKNAFIQPFKSKVDEDIKFSDAQPKKKGSVQEKKVSAHEKRKEKRQKRRQERAEKKKN